MYMVPIHWLIAFQSRCIESTVIVAVAQ